MEADNVIIWVHCAWCRQELRQLTGSRFLPWHTEDPEADRVRSWSNGERGCPGAGIDPEEAEALVKIRDAEGGRLMRAAHP